MKNTSPHTHNMGVSELKRLMSSFYLVSGAPTVSFNSANGLLVPCLKVINSQLSLYILLKKILILLTLSPFIKMPLSGQFATMKTRVGVLSSGY